MPLSSNSVWSVLPESVQQPEDATTYSPPAASEQQKDYWGSGPGLDWADLIDNPIVHGVGTALDTLARPVRTILGTGDVGRSFESIWNPDKAVSAEDLRKQYLFDDQGTKGDGFIHGDNPVDWDWGDVIDELGNFGVAALTDPATFLTAGATAAGKNATRAGQELMTALKSQAGRLTPEARAAAIDAFGQATGKTAMAEQLKTTIPTNFTGMEPTLTGRIMQGESGLRFGLPHLPFMPAPGEGLTIPMAKPVLAAAAPLIDPLHTAVDVYKNTIGATKVGQQIGKWASEAKDWISNPEIRTAAGFIQKSAEDVANEEAKVAMGEVEGSWKRASASGLTPEHRALAGDLVETFDRDNRVPSVNQRPEGFVGPLDQDLRTKAGLESYQARNERIVNAVQSMTTDQQAAFYAYARDLHEMPFKIQDRMTARGVHPSVLGDAKVGDLNSTKEEIFKREAAIKEAQPKDPTPPGQPTANAEVTPTPPPSDGAAMGIYSRRDFRDQLIGEARLPQDRADAVVGVTDALAKSWGSTEGRDWREWYSEKLAGVRASDGAAGGDLNQVRRAAVGIGPDGRAIIHAFEGADATSVLHEVGHVLRNSLSDGEKTIIQDWLRQQHGIEVPQGGWFWDLKNSGVTDPAVLESARKAEELYAQAWQRFLQDGYAPTKGLRAVFDKLKSWMSDTFHAVTGLKPSQINMTQEVRDHFSRMLGGISDETRTALGEVRSNWNPEKLAETLGSKGWTTKEIAGNVPRLRKLKYTDSEIAAMEKDAALSTTLANPKARVREAAFTDTIEQLKDKLAGKGWTERDLTYMPTLRSKYGMTNADIEKISGDEARNLIDNAKEKYTFGGGDQGKPLNYNAKAVADLRNPKDWEATRQQFKLNKELGLEGTAQDRELLANVAEEIAKARTVDDALAALRKLPGDAETGIPHQIWMQRLAPAFGLKGGKKTMLKDLLDRFPGEREVTIPYFKKQVSLDAQHGTGEGAVSMMDNIDAEAVKDRYRGEYEGGQITPEELKQRQEIEARQSGEPEVQAAPPESTRPVATPEGAGPKTPTAAATPQAASEAVNTLEEEIRSAIRNGEKRVTFDFTDPEVRAHFEKLGGEVKDDFTGKITKGMRSKMGEVDQLRQMEGGVDSRSTLADDRGEGHPWVQDAGLRAIKNPKFKEWFGASEVASKDGVPRVMYHGSPASDIRKFEPSQHGVIYVADNPVVASDYARSGGYDRIDTKGAKAGGPGVLPVFVSAKKVLNAHTEQGAKELMELRLALEDSGKFTPAQLKLLEPTAEGLPHWELGHDKELVDELKSRGYDGIYLDEETHRSLAVFDPKQLKSATGNKGTYSTKTADILEQAGPVQPVPPALQKQYDNDPELQALYAKRDLLSKQIREIPHYVPFRGTEEAELAAAKEKGGSGKGYQYAGVNAERKSVFSDNNLEGVPMTRAEAEAEFKRGSAGTKGTLGKDVNAELSLWDGIKKFFKGKKGAEEAKQMTLGKGSLFESDPTKGWARQITGSYRQTILRSQLSKDFANTFNSIPVAEWENVAKLAGEGKSLAEIDAAFEKATGMKASALLAPEAKAGLESGRFKTTDVFKANSAPAGWQEMKGFAQDAKTGAASDHFLPQQAAERYQQILDWSNKKLPEFLRLATAPLAEYGKLWKPWQTWMFPKFHIRNQIGDMWRMAQTDSMDVSTAGDLAKLYSPIGKVWTEGPGNFSHWKDTIFDAGESGLAKFGSRQVSGEQVMKALSQEGLIGSGWVGSEMMSALDKELAQGDSIVQKVAGKLKQPIPDGAKNILAFREDANKVAAVLARMRAGDSFTESVLRAEEALFNFNRVSPGVQFLRQTGIAPFAAWASKNLPAQVEWAVLNPGQFAGVYRAMNMMQAGILPETALPAYMRDKFNMVVEKKTDEKGKPVWSIGSASGFIPITDLTDAMNNPMLTVKDSVGPLFKTLMALDWSGGNDIEAKGVSADDLGNAILGKPFQYLKEISRSGTVDPYTGRPSEGALGVLKSELTPFSVKDVDVENKIGKAQRQLQRQVDMAAGSWRTAMGRLNQAQAAYQDQDPEIFSRLQDNALKAKQEYFKVKEQAERETRENSKTLAAARALAKAP
jgi:hypothetical protein